MRRDHRGAARPPAEIANAALTGRRYPVAALVERVVLASPRGYCAGVERAVDTVERALRLYGEPVYVRKQIVHNSHVVRELEERGAIFVDSVEDVPPGATVVFSAHGVSPAVREAAAARNLVAIDATCPLVTKVHTQARRYAAAGYTVVLIGHAGHEEVEGTMGEAPESTMLVESVADAERLDLSPGARVAYITQTTLSVDETREIIDVLRSRFPQLQGPAREDICYATSNRQWAVKALLDDDTSEIRPSWLEGASVVGLTSGASAPERLVADVCDWFRDRGVTDIVEHRSAYEDVVFKLPVELRRAERSAA